MLSTSCSLIKLGTPTPRRGRWDLSHSANLYLTPRQGELYEAVRATPSYAETIVAPLRESRTYLPLALKLFRGTCERPIAFYDCGPADPAEVVSLARGLAQICTLHRYVIVDVNETLLADSVRALTRRSRVTREVVGRHMAFEEFSLEREGLPPSVDCVLYFGATGLNYTPDAFQGLLQSMCTPATLVVTQTLITCVDDDSSAYQDEAVRRFTFEPIRLMGGREQDFIFRVERRTDRLDVEFIARRPLTLHHDEPIAIDGRQRIRTAFSRRQTWSGLARELDTLFDTRLTIINNAGVALTVGRLRRG